MNDEPQIPDRAEDLPSEEPLTVLPADDVPQEEYVLARLAEEEPLEVLPVRPPHPNFWWSLLWCLGYLTVTQTPGFVVFILVAGVLFAIKGPQNIPKTQEALLKSREFSLALLYAFAVIGPLTILSAWLAVRMVVGKEWPRKLALRLPSFTHLVLALLATPCLIVLGHGFMLLVKLILNRLVGDVGGNSLEQTIKLMADWPVSLAVLLIGLCPGIAEELFCRGFLGRGLVGRHGPVVGVMLTSFLFGLIHLIPIQVIYAMLMGLFLHFLYLSTRSLVASMLVHFGNNAFAMIELHIPQLQALDDVKGALPPAILFVAAALLLAAITWALYRSRARLVTLSVVAPWEPDYPGVELPPPESGTTVTHPWPGLLPTGLLLATAGGFGWAIFATGTRLGWW